MEKKEKKGRGRGTYLKIDYDNIDVADIMKQIKEKIAQEAEKPSPERHPMEEPSPGPAPPSIQEPGDEEEESAGFKAKIKRLLLKIMRPFAPIIKLLIFPVHVELMETVKRLHQTNKRLDFTHARIDQVQDALNNRINEVNSSLHGRLDEVSNVLKSINEELARVNKRINSNYEKTNRRIDSTSRTINKRLDSLFANLGRTMEYTKLLHNLSHNMVVELSKLKVEEERLRSKTRIMEKDFEFLGKREKALEKIILK